MNKAQQKVLKAWGPLLLAFVQREWFSILIWSGLGALVAATTRLVLQDRVFKSFAVATYLPSAKHFDDTRQYLSYLIVVAITALVAGTIYGLEIIPRGIKSWIRGVTSGLCLLSFVSMFVVLTLHRGTIERQLITDLAIVVLFFLITYVLHVAARIYAERTLNEEDLWVASQSRSLIGTEIAESDDPIQSWREDALGRAALVDGISSKLMIAKSPVLAVFGEFGSGKTSILNLLREHLGKKAIVVSFSTWLPGSQETLTSYLLSDIATECQKQYVVPGLSKSARRLASALGQSVPFVKGYLEFLPAPTQRDDIKSMNAALARLPKRVVVLLDELDRMEREELLTLLKVIRGVSTLRNLSFVCALDLKTVIKTVKGEEDNEQKKDENLKYFDKFFPVSIQIPTSDADELRKAGVERLVAGFNRRNWFYSKSEEDQFRQQIDGLWNDLIAPFCRNLRAIGLLSNDVSTSAALLKREVNPVDLTLVELLRRFKPSVYDLVGSNFVTLTGGESWLKGRGKYYSDEDKERFGSTLLEDLKKAAKSDEQLGQIKGILSELFPLFEKLDGKTFVSRKKRLDFSKGETRIFHPGLFPAYFRYELPQAIFSSVELEEFLKKIEKVTADRQEHEFREVLDSMEKGSPKRDDFLRKLSDSVQSLSPQVRREMALICIHAADKLTYDKVLLLGEAGHVLRLVNRVAEKTPQTERAALLSQCIAEASDDTMALWILTKLAGKQSGFDLGVSLEDIYPSFAKRMRARYGRDVNAANVDLSTADQQAFNLWASHDTDDRSAQHDFWLRYIGESRTRLADTFLGIFMPLGIYETDPTPFVENKISISDLGRPYDSLPDDPGLTETQRKSLQWLKRLLDGEFKNGIGFGQLDEESSAGAVEDEASQTEA